MALTPLVITDHDGSPVGSVIDYDLDLDYGLGSASNDFTLTIRNSNLQPQLGGKIYVDGTDIGGIIDRLKDDVVQGTSSLTWTGRTWSGILEGKIIEPASGQDYYTASGPLSTVVGNVINKVGLSSLFTMGTTGGETVSGYKFDRYTTAWKGLSKLLKSSGMKLQFREANNIIYVNVLPIDAHTQDSDQIDFSVERTYRRVNHIIGLGKGKLRNRKVINYYADEHGDVSLHQTFKGSDEITVVYEDASEDDEDQPYGPDVTANELTKFSDKVKEKLKDQQGEGTVEVTIPEGMVLDIGDLVHGQDNESGLQVDAQISRKTVKVKNGLLNATYEVGKDTSTTGGLLGSEGSTGGVVYMAGSGVHISGGIITTDVTKADIDTVNGDVSQVRNDLQGTLRQAQEALAAANEAKRLAQQSSGAVDVSDQIYLYDSRFSVRKWAYKIGNLVVLVFRAYNNGSAFSLSAWQTHTLMTTSWSIANNNGELNYVVGNNRNNNMGIQVDGTSINIRGINTVNVDNGAWLSGSIAWSI